MSNLSSIAAHKNFKRRKPDMHLIIEDENYKLVELEYPDEPGAFVGVGLIHKQTNETHGMISLDKDEKLWIMWVKKYDAPLGALIMPTSRGKLKEEMEFLWEIRFSIEDSRGGSK